MKRSLSLILILLLLLTVLSGCNETSTNSQNQEVNNEKSSEEKDNSKETASDSGEAKKDSLTLVTVLKAESLNPYSGSYGEKTVPRMMFDTLMNYDEKGNFVPCLAESWEDDGMNLTVKLRKDVDFTDGEHFTADDVIFAYKQYSANPTFAARLDTIGTCEKIDEYTVVFHKNKPYSAILAALTEQFSIVSSKAYSSNPNEFEENPVGSGPYKYVSQDVDGSVNFIANENYFLGAPSIKNVTIKPPVDPSTAVIALQAGEVDLVANVPMAQKQLIEDDSNLVFVEKKAWIMSTLLLSGEKFNDENLRKAIYYALDLESIVLIGNEGVGEPASNLSTELIMGKYVGKVPFGEYDVEKAKEFLTKSNYKNGTELTLSVTPDFASVAQVIQSNLNAIDINVKIEQLDLNSLYAKMFSGAIEMTVTYIGNATTPLEAIIDGYNTSPFDMMLHKNPELSKIIDDMKEESNQDARGEYILAALENIKENADFIPLFEVASTAAYNKSLEGVQDIFAASYLYYINQMSYK